MCLPHTDYSSSLSSWVHEPAPLLQLARVVGYDDVHVVEDVESVLLIVFPANDAGIFGVALLVDVATHGEAGGAVGLVALHGIAPGHLREKSYNAYNSILTHTHVCVFKRDTCVSFCQLTGMLSTIQWCW